MAKQATRIMVVDGSSVSRTILTRTLRSEILNAEVLSCESGNQALQQLKEEGCDLITTAILLPDMDGLDLSRRIRKSKRHHYTPVIVVSGDADERLLREGFKAGVTDYFDKSQGYQAFGDFIKAFIQRNSGLVGRILFVEDSQTTAAITCKILEKHGLMVEHCLTAETALKLLQMENDNAEATEVFDLIITDFYLKGTMTGGDLIHAVRANMHYLQQELPILVITGTGDRKTQVAVFHAGANDFVAKPIIEEVMMARIRALLLIKHQYDALKQQAENMRWIAATDSLTGVRSKRYLLDYGEDYIKEPSQQPVWAMLIDIDYFKQINDTMGHITGDHVLANLGEILNQTFSDSMVVRFGGEEFCVLLPRSTNALERAEDLRLKIASLKPAGVDLNISVGLSSTKDYPKASLTQLITLADKALYAAKETGRNRVCVYNKTEHSTYKLVRQ